MRTHTHRDCPLQMWEGGLRSHHLLTASPTTPLPPQTITRDLFFPQRFLHNFSWPAWDAQYCASGSSAPQWGRACTPVPPLPASGADVDDRVRWALGDGALEGSGPRAPPLLPLTSLPAPTPRSSRARAPVEPRRRVRPRVALVHLPDAQARRGGLGHGRWAQQRRPPSRTLPLTQNRCCPTDGVSYKAVNFGTYNYAHLFWPAGRENDTLSVVIWLHPFSYQG